MKDIVLRLGYDVDRFVKCLDLESRFACMPKMYFEFNTMHDMCAAQAAILEDINHRMLVCSGGEPIRRVDKDCVEIQVCGMVIVLRCMERLHTTHGTDVGYTEVKFGRFDPREIEKITPND